MADGKEIELHCNNLRCRVAVSISGQAVVTNCSHIFCVPCASSLIGPDRICPTCNAHLPGEDEITSMRLSPGTEWKASVLSGLSPSVILEIATRAMSFWTYQTAQLSYVDFSLDIRAPASTQAIFYLRNSAFQEYVVNQAKERVHGLEAQLHQAEENRQAQEREHEKLREQLQIQTAQMYKISDELKTVKDELQRVSTQKRQLQLKQPLGNAMDLQEAVNGQLNFEGSDDGSGSGAGQGYSQANGNRAPFMATPRGSIRGSAVPPGTGSRRSDAALRKSHPIQGPLGSIPHPQSRPHAPNYGLTGQPIHTSSNNNQGFGTVTPAFGAGNTARDPRGMSLTGQQKMRDNLAQMQGRIPTVAEGARERQPLANISNGMNGRSQNHGIGQNGGAFGIKGGGTTAVPLRSTNYLQQRRYAM